jgi:DNA-binding NarL/FixJ family response regulator
MVLVATPDPKLALKLGRAIEGEKAYLVHAGSARELRHQVHACQPEVVVLDVRLGGNLFRALDEAARLIATRSQPAVVVLTPVRARAVEREAGRLGCFDVINLDRRACAAHVARAVSEAAAARLSGALEPPPRRRARESLH